MMKIDESRQLLPEFLSGRSEAAFAEIVTRYSGMVYSTALRRLDGATAGPGMSRRRFLSSWHGRLTVFRRGFVSVAGSTA
ncbi:hypothetical protein V2O64_14255 [Verrucomicrobiaceae bacterium 227]